MVNSRNIRIMSGLLTFFVLISIAVERHTRSLSGDPYPVSAEIVGSGYSPETWDSGVTRRWISSSQFIVEIYDLDDSCTMWTFDLLVTQDVEKRFMKIVRKSSNLFVVDSEMPKSLSPNEVVQITLQNDKTMRFGFVMFQISGIPTRLSETDKRNAIASVSTPTLSSESC